MSLYLLFMAAFAAYAGMVGTNAQAGLSPWPAAARSGNDLAGWAPLALTAAMDRGEEVKGAMDAD